MTNQRLRYWMIVVNLIYGLAILFGIAVKFIQPDLWEIFKTLSVFLLAIPATWLAYCFQRRISYMQSLRGFWRHLVEAVQSAIQYTHLDTGESPPSQAQFGEVMLKLSCCTDDLRCVFKNLNEKAPIDTSLARDFVFNVRGAKNIEDLVRIIIPRRQNVGLFPFQSLKEIQHCISILGYGDNFTKERSNEARAKIVALWGILRFEMLREFDRAEPQYPETPFRGT